MFSKTASIRNIRAASVDQSLVTKPSEAEQMKQNRWNMIPNFSSSFLIDCASENG